MNIQTKITMTPAKLVVYNLFDNDHDYESLVFQDNVVRYFAMEGLQQTKTEQL
jgi:hypothetical protein